MVSNDEGIHIVILRQIRIGILELANLLRIEHMNMTLIMAQLAILPEGIDQAVTIDGCGLQTDLYFAKLELVHCRHNFL